MAYRMRNTVNSRLLEKLSSEHDLSSEEWSLLFGSWTSEDASLAAMFAEKVAEQHFGRRIYVRGLLEFTNYCRNDCLYCGLRRSNGKCRRYRLDHDEIMSSATAGYSSGYRTIVLQGGEDPWYTPERMASLIISLKERFDDCAVTLSVGEVSRDVYELWRKSGADRYLLRHESADKELYGSLHPFSQSWQHRMDCLKWLKELGYQFGCGFMVGVPGQTTEHLVKEMLFLKSIDPSMVGIGPFIPHELTPLSGAQAGSAELTLFCLSLIRLMLPSVLLPATTALATLLPNGYELGVQAGANVIMQNISPTEAIRNYVLYNRMEKTSALCPIIGSALHKRLQTIGYEIDTGRGDYRAVKEVCHA